MEKIRTVVHLGEWYRDSLGRGMRKLSVVTILYPNRSLGYTGVSMSKLIEWALAGAAQWSEGRTVNQKVAGSIPSQGTCLSFRAQVRSPVGGFQEAAK